MGFAEISLNTTTKPFSFLSHCKVSCGSPCCVKICGEDNHCNCSVDTHGYDVDREIIIIIIIIIIYCM